jgi:hypothetical protein
MMRRPGREAMASPWWSRSLWLASWRRPASRAALSRLLRIGGRALNLRHVIVAYRISFAIVPRNRNLAPRGCDNCTKVSCRGGTAPANSVAGPECSRLIASHFPPSKKPQALAHCGSPGKKFVRYENRPNPVGKANRTPGLM